MIHRVEKSTAIFENNFGVDTILHSHSSVKISFFALLKTIGIPKGKMNRCIDPIPK